MTPARPSTEDPAVMVHKTGIRLASQLAPAIFAAGLLGCGNDKAPLVVSPATGSVTIPIPNNSDTGPDGTRIRPYCDEQIVEVQGLDTPTGSVNARHMLTQAGASHGLGIRGWSQEVMQVAKPVPNSHERTAQLTLHSNAQGYRHIKAKEVQCQTGLPCNAGPISCKNRFELDVTVGLRSDDGALNENWPAVLNMNDPRDPRAVADNRLFIIHQVLSNQIVGSMKFPQYIMRGKEQLTRHEIQLDAFFEGGSLKQAGLTSLFTMTYPGTPVHPYTNSEVLYRFEPR